MQETQSRVFNTQDPGLLNVLVMLVENLKLLITGPLVIGLCALGISFVLP
jgi:hypothetical protein